MLDKLISTNNRLIELEFQKYEIEASREKLIIEMLNDLKEKNIWNKFPTEYSLTFSDEDLNLIKRDYNKDGKFYYEITSNLDSSNIYIVKYIYKNDLFKKQIKSVVDYIDSEIRFLDADLFTECMELLNSDKCVKFVFDKQNPILINKLK